MSLTVADLTSPFVHSLLEEVEELREEVKELKRLIFGSKKERFIPAPDKNQLSLELGNEPLAAPVVVKQTVRYQRMVTKLGRKPIRQPFPAHLPRVTVVIEPQEDVSGMHKIGEEVTEELDRSGEPSQASVSVCSPLRPAKVRKQGRYVSYCSTSRQSH